MTSELKRRSRSRLSANRGVAQRFDELFMPDNHEHKWAREYLYGIEHNFDLATASKVNMILHGDGSSNIFHQDGLKPFRFYQKPSGTNQLRATHQSAVYPDHEVNEQFDVIVSNPPFSVDLDDDTKRYLGTEFIFGRKKNLENLFIERYYQLLRPLGRLAVILPESVFDTTENKYIRLFLFMYFDVVAVVSLPRISFEPYTQTKTSVLFARKKTAQAVQSWQQLWNEKVARYSWLRTRALNYIKVHIDGENLARLPSIRDEVEAERFANLAAFLQLEFSAEETAKPFAELVTDYRLLIDETAERDTDAGGPFGIANSRWVLREVTKSMDQEIFAAEAAHVGYKRTKRGLRQQSNDLFDREVAPSQLAADELARAFADDEARLTSALATLQARRDENAAAKATATKVRELARLDDRIGQVKGEQERLESARAQIAAVVDRCYENNRLRSEYVDRLDKDLLKIFEHPLLIRWRSDQVITTRTTPQSILEEMRSKALWS